MSKSYCGYISIIGKPNVGKSTILNHILGKKISITSRKSQTTRNNILGIKTEGNKQMIYADTPGMHIKSPKVMNKVLNRSAESLMEDSDIILFVIQRLTLDEQDLSVLKKLKQIDTKVICVVNKVDQVTDKNKLLPLIDRLSNEYNFLDIIPISAINNDGIHELENLIKKYLPENEHLYDKNAVYVVAPICGANPKPQPSLSLNNIHFPNFTHNNCISIKTITKINALQASADLSKISLMIITRPKPPITGIDIRNEKRAALFLSSPNNKPAVMVMPDRDVPGINATA